MNVNNTQAVVSTGKQDDILSRHSSYQNISSYLSSLTEEEIRGLLDKAQLIAHGIGGKILSLEINGQIVFIKKIPITELEKQNTNSTANLFNLPLYYQYNVGSKGFGVWRELRMHEITTQWVLNQECPNFPILYHSRLLNRREPTISSPEELAKMEESIKNWGSSLQIRQRLEAIQNASTDMFLFMEHLPMTLHKWIKNELPKETEELTISFIQMEKELHSVVAFMKEHGVLHLDSHFHNVLTDGKHVYFTDFGLATALEFQLSKEEKNFFQIHADYDGYYVSAELARRALVAIKGQQAYENLLNEYRATGKIDTKLSPKLAPIVERLLPIAACLYSFREDLEENKEAVYPF